MRMRVLLVVSGFMMTLAGCSSGSYGTSSTPTSPSVPSSNGGPTATVAIPSGAQALGTNAFGANPQTVTAGTTVMWTNTDSVPHTTTSDSGAWNSGTMAPGSNFSVLLSTTGTFRYHCSIHPGMMGTITVQ